MYKMLTPNVMVGSMEESIAFYRDILGFALENSVPDAPPFNWASLRNGDVSIMLQTRPSLESDLPVFTDKPIGATLNFFVVVAGIEGLYERIKTKVKIVADFKTTFYGMKEFSIQDPNGYVLTFAEPAQG